MTQPIAVDWPEHYKQEYNDMLSRIQQCEEPKVLKFLAEQCCFSLYEIMSNCAGPDKTAKQNELIVGWNFQTAHGTLSCIHHTIPDGEIYPVLPVLVTPLTA